MLQDRVRVIRIDLILFPDDTKQDAEFFADLIIQLLDIFPQYRMKKKCGGYFGYIFTGNPDLAKKIGLKANRRIEFFNSTIDCRLLEYELYEGSRR